MMKAIRTEYQGITFDSKLETQWARFYDLLSIPWEYEKEKIELAPGLRYIPDFWLSTLHIWHEMKGTIVNDAAGLLMTRKCLLLAQQTNAPVALTFASPMNARCALFLPDGSMTTHARFGMCPICGALGLIYHQHKDRFVICTHPYSRLTLRNEQQRRRAIYDAAKISDELQSTSMALSVSHS